jgi:hypothetical protein
MGDHNANPGSSFSPDNAAKSEAVRRDSPSAWMALVGNQTIPLVIDALLDAPPRKEFNKTELGEYAGVNPESIRNHIETLLNFQIVEEVPDSQPTRYRLDTDSPTVKRLFQLHGALNQVGSTDQEVEAEREDTGDRQKLQPTPPTEPRYNQFSLRTDS